MIKNYLDTSHDVTMNPKKETVDFLISFSKTLKVVKTKSNQIIELNLN